MLEAGKLGRHMYPNDFDKGQIVTARQQGESISKTAGLAECSWYAVDSTYQKSKEGKLVNQ